MGLISTHSVTLWNNKFVVLQFRILSYKFNVTALFLILVKTEMPIAHILILNQPTNMIHSMALFKVRAKNENIFKNMLQSRTSIHRKCQ